MSFEDKKQEIISLIENNYQCDSMQDIDTRIYIIELINQLTPQKPPTCASCNKQAEIDYGYHYNHGE